MRRTKAALLAVLVASTIGGGIATAEPEPAPPPPLPAVALLTLTTTPGGWESRVDLRPQLQVFPDGRAIRVPDAASPDRAPETLPQQLNGHIPTEVLTTALTETRAIAQLDLGTPSVSDQGSKIIDLMGDQPDQDAHAVMYAPEFTEGLSTEQQSTRIRFNELYRKLLDSFVQDR